MITICIDYDGTFDRIPGIFARFILDCRANGCRVFVVSCRHCECTDEAACESHRDIKEFTAINLQDHGDGSASISVLLTNGAPKRWFMEERGIKVDIWIDDEPMTIEYGR